MTDYEDYELESKRIREANDELLDEFDLWLVEKGLADKTIERHISNINFFINYFLLTEDMIEAKDGIDEIGDFLGNWFIRKAMWSSAAHIKSNAASFKKFYTFMFEKGFIERYDLDILHGIIKEEMPYWLEIMEKYLDPDVSILDIWGY